MKELIHQLSPAQLNAVLAALKRGRRPLTHDVAIPFRMGAGVAGDVNRSHPANIVPGLNDPTNPITVFGQACMGNSTASSYRAVLTSDQAGATDIIGVAVRPYPIQQASATNYGAQALGAGAAPPLQPLDVLLSGFIMVPVVGTPAKFGAVYIWAAASTGSHVLGGFESQASAGNTFQITDPHTYWNSPPDATGIAELALHI